MCVFVSLRFIFLNAAKIAVCSTDLNLKVFPKSNKQRHKARLNSFEFPTVCFDAVS